MARSTVTARQLLYDAKALLGARDSIHPNEAEGLRFLNYSVFTLSNLLNGLYSAWEKKTQAISRNNADGVSDIRLKAGASESYTASTRIITCTDPHGLGNNHLNGLVALYDELGGYYYLAVIQSIPSTTTFKIWENTPLTDIAAGNLSWIPMSYPWHPDGLSLYGLNIKQVNALVDATNGSVVRLAPQEWEGFEDNPNLASSVGMMDFGDGIWLKKGSNISSYGTLTLHYNADPAELTAITDSVDLEPEHHAMVVNDVARQIEKAYPDLGSRKNQGDPFADLRKLYETVEKAFIEKTSWQR